MRSLRLKIRFNRKGRKKRKEFLQQSMPIKTVRLENKTHLAALIAVGLLSAIFAVFAAKWSLAHAIATRADSKELAEFTTNLAPSDPQTHFSVGVLSEKTFLPGDFERALAAYERAVALSPNDYLLWLALGEARESSGDPGGAERAFRRALALAPNYSRVQWALGNALLRRGAAEEGFQFIRQAAENDEKYVTPAVAAAWQLSGGDLALVKQSVGDSPQMRAALAAFLAREKRFDEALQIWSALPEAEKRTGLKESGEEIYKLLLAEKRFRDALAIQAQLDEGQDFTVGKITNADFEANVKVENAALFEWQIAQGLQPQIGIDERERRGGSRSLGLVFNSPDGREFRQISQTVAVESGKSYELTAFYKSDLKTAATVRWEIADASGGQILAATEPVAENADWSGLKADFEVPENTQAVVIRLARFDCKSAICPISGKVWFDDFMLRQK